MDFTLSEELLILRKTVRDFADRDILPVVEADERAHRFQRELVSKMGALGFLGCPIPEEYGGSGMGYLAHAIACEEISRVSGSLRAAFNMQTMGTSLLIVNFGTEEQKKKYVPGLVNADLLGCFCITEPNAGSDTAAISTVAVKEGDFYCLNGTKTWISYAPVADVAIVFAYTDRSQKHRGLSAFIVEMKTPGISIRPLEDKMGWHCSPTGQIFFEDARIPKSSLLGEEGMGFKIMMSDLNNTRLSASSGAVGAAQGLIDEAVKYSRQRIQFGQEIGQFQMVQEMIARMIVETEAARLLVYKCASQKDQGLVNNTLETSMAKYYSCDVASRVADLALQILGAYGYSAEYPVERYLRDAKLYQILEGSANIHKMIIATDALGYRKANR